MLAVGEGLLLREHAHRVSNDMSVAVAALRLAERRVGAEPVIASAIARLDAAARVQRLLCEPADGPPVDLSARLRQLCGAMAMANPLPGSDVTVVAPAALVAAGDAWLISLCVHELVGNALRNGGRLGATVKVEVCVDGASMSVAVIDRGPSRDWARPGGRGTAIVDALAARLGGEVSRTWVAHGGRVKVSIRAASARAVPLSEVA